MSDGTVKVREASTGKDIDNELLSDGSYRQRVRVGGANPDDLAPVQDTDQASSAMGLVTRPVLAPGTARIGRVGIDASDGPAGDAFGRIRTSNPTTLFEVSHQYDLAPELMGLAAQDAGTTISHSPPAATLNVPATVGNRIVHQSHIYHHYQPGKSQLVRITGQLGNGAVIVGMGYGDDDDGVFVERNAGGLEIQLKSSTVVGDQTVTQASWNADPLDGTGSSGYTLDPGAIQHVVIDLQWLAVGRVRVGFEVSGSVVWAHYFDFANVASAAYMRTGSLPVRWYAESLGSTGAGQAICATVISEGGHAPLGHPFAYALETEVTLTSSFIPLLSLRPAATFGGVTNHGHIHVQDILALATTGDDVLVKLVRGATLTGASWSSTDSRSLAEVDESASAYSGGTDVWTTIISSQSRTSFVGAGRLRGIPITLKADGSQDDLLTIVARRFSNPADVLAGFNWQEMR